MIMEGISTLKRHKVEFNTLTVVNSENVHRALDVDNFLKRIGSRYIQFIPLVERVAASSGMDQMTLIKPDFSGQSRVTEWSVPAEKWGEFMNIIFSHWAQHDLGEIFVMNFEQAMSKMCGYPGACTINETCGGNLILEANGDVYSCDHFVYSEYKLGNINDDNIVSLVNSSKNQCFGLIKKT